MFYYSLAVGFILGLFCTLVAEAVVIILNEDKEKERRKMTWEK